MSTSINRNLSSESLDLKKKIDFQEAGAVFSDDRRYRYLLWRRWSENKPLILFIGLNPSTADETIDDPTIRRCRGFAKSWSAGGFMIANLFAFRATLPMDLFVEKAPIGPKNDLWIRAASDIAARTIACWGNHGTHQGRSAVVMPLLLTPEHLKITKAGQPSHPLYLPSALTPSRNWPDSIFCARSEKKSD